ncbi:hypothetical protein JXA80_05585 [bacterium]|nr:hypothetical protein [candidate division CSSED10-310 bacterium]
MMRYLVVGFLVACTPMFVAADCSADDWAGSLLPILPEPGPDAIAVDTESTATIYNSASNWICRGDLHQGWQLETVSDRPVVCLDVATEENELLVATACTDGSVWYRWRSPAGEWKSELIESFPPNAVGRVEIERGSDGSIWIAVLFHDTFYLYQSTPDGWMEYSVEGMPTHIEDQASWRFEVDGSNRLHLVRQTQINGFHHVTGIPGDWIDSQIDSIRYLPGKSCEFTLTGMEMRRDNMPVLMIAGTAVAGGVSDIFTAAVVGSEGDWETVECWSRSPGVIAYDYARDRLHCAYVYYSNDYYPQSMEYYTVKLGKDSRDAHSPSESPSYNYVYAMTIGKLDLPHVVGRYVTYQGIVQYYYNRPPADITIEIESAYYPEHAWDYKKVFTTIRNWKWETPIRLGVVADIAGALYWWPDWSGTPELHPLTLETGYRFDEIILAPIDHGTAGITITFYTALLHPVDNVMLNGQCVSQTTLYY